MHPAPLRSACSGAARAVGPWVQLAVHLGGASHHDPLPHNMAALPRKKMDVQENRGCKLFQDSVHDVMRFHRLIVKIIDTREFQRLRNIKQLSTTYLVFPAAAHNRFEHCLGVCYLAGKMLEELEKNSRDVWCTIIKDDEEDQKVKLAVQIAALLHDIGHGPFSHTWESFVSACGGKWEHEDTSCDIIDLMLYEDKQKKQLTNLGKEFEKEFKPDMDKYIIFIKNVIKGHVPDDEKEKSFLYEIVSNASNDIDVDKFDYFLRDAQHLGMGVSFDYKRLLCLCRVLMFPDGRSHVAFRDVEKYSIQGMFRLRADLHFKAYQHRVAKCIETMLLDGLKAADQLGFKFRGYPLSRVHENPHVFVRMTDSIRELVENSEEDEFQEAREILDRISERDLYQTVGEWALNVTQTKEEIASNKVPKGLTASQQKELLKALGEKDFAVSQIRVNQGKFFNPMTNVYFYQKDGSSSETSVLMPSIHMQLPFYKVYIFRRAKEEYNTERVKKVVNYFLSENGFVSEEAKDNYFLSENGFVSEEAKDV